MSKEKLLTIRIDERLYQQFKDLVKVNDSSVSDVIRDFIKDCVRNQSIQKSIQNIGTNSSIQSEEIHKKLYTDLYADLYNELKSDIHNAMFTHKLEFHSQEIIDLKPVGVAKTEENLVNQILDTTNTKSLTQQGLENDPNQGLNAGESVIIPEEENKGQNDDSQRTKNQQECDRELTHEDSKAKIKELRNKGVKTTNIATYLNNNSYPDRDGNIGVWHFTKVNGELRNINKPQNIAGTTDGV